MLRQLIFLIFFIYVGITNTHGEEIHLKNGDRISGKIIEETTVKTIIETQAMGIISVDRDFTLYPSLSERGEYRLHSETALVNPISDHVAWKVSFIDDYKSNPSGNIKKNDFQLISSIDYLF